MPNNHIVYANRASAILCNFLKSNEFKNPFLLPANVCPVVPLSFIKAHVPFEFVDIDKTHAMNQTLCLDALKTKTYSGVLFVHSYGKVFDIANFKAEARTINSGICFIEDKCLCVPSFNGEKLDAALTLFSTGYAKFVELQYGGYAFVDNAYDYNHFCWNFKKSDDEHLDLYLKECFRNETRYTLGDIAWMDSNELQQPTSEYIDFVESRIIDISADKRLINDIYNSLLPKELIWGEDYTSWRYMMSVPNRNHLLEVIFEHKLFAGTNYPSVAYMFGGVYLPEAEKEAEEVLNLFNDYRVNEEFAEKISKIIISTI